MAQSDTLHKPQQPPAGEQGAVHWLAVQAGGGRYLVPLTQAGEIFPTMALQRVPYTRPWFLGVAALRGTLCGVVDLAQFLAFDGAAAGGTAAPAEAKLLSLHPALELNCALRVDQLAGLRGADAFVRSEPAPPQAPDYVGQRCIDGAGLAWQELDLQALARAPSFLSIAA